MQFDFFFEIQNQSRIFFCLSLLQGEDRKPFATNKIKRRINNTTAEEQITNLRLQTKLVQSLKRKNTDYKSFAQTISS